MLALVSTSVGRQYTDPALRVRHLFAVANDVLESASVALEFNVVQIQTVDYPDGPDASSALDDVTFGSDPSLTGVAALRESVHADLVRADSSLCERRLLRLCVDWRRWNGRRSSPLRVNADFGYAVAASDCSDYVLIHELRHTLGLVHSRARIAWMAAASSYGAGYGRDNDFVTIMATLTLFNAVQLPVLSDPQRNCDGMPCGVDYADPLNGADSARALKVTMGQVATYR